jgi:hypothetical protein
VLGGGALVHAVRLEVMRRDLPLILYAFFSQSRSSPSKSRGDEILASWWR